LRTILALSFIWAAVWLSGLAASPLPSGLLLAGAVQDSTVLVVGERGAIHRSTDGGNTWVASTAPVRVMLTGVAFAPAGRQAWAVGHEAVVLGSSDRGATWTVQFRAPNPQDSLLDIIALSEGHVLAVGAYGLCVESLDGGKTWQRRRLIADDVHFNRITRGPTGELYLAGERGTLLRSRDAGATWQPLHAPYDGSFYGVLPLDRRTLLAHGLRGRLFRSADDGATWRPVDTGSTGLLAASLQLKGNFLLVGGSIRGLLVSRDYGATFVSLPGAPTAALSALLQLPDGRILALGEDGAVALPAPR
jgi:photosystem II stability/assembly factor-like uncharacterized protein